MVFLRVFVTFRGFVDLSEFRSSATVQNINALKLNVTKAVTKKISASISKAN